ncbi:lipocalin family protein [Flavobacterium sp. J372]|uniref:lipocalin family protein n=1 Tax=Flavobacterium sp. J372 TaxID=2898436 RepID=UPI002150DCA7|nr:lipocalin family protein [Flavobacterium sp. J372]MCR5862986.1 lipocalin family protein [Flavobacterium sp. J372]
MKRFLFLAIAIVVSACSGKIDEAELTHLNGYWEIEKAEMPDGETKEYAVNSTVDYFEIKDNKGFRKKVMPQLDGSYRTGSSDEKINVSDEDTGTYINYKTDYATWKERIVELDEDELVLKNDHGMVYHYKRFKPFSIKE